MRTICKEISLDQYIILKDVWLNAESVTEEDFNLQILDLFPNSPELYDYFIEHNICPECQGKLELMADGEEVYEFQGKNVRETNYYLICSMCGTEYDKHDD